MYYKEQLINEIWHYKLSPNAEWKPFSAEQLNCKITELKEYAKSEYYRGVSDGKIIAEHGTTMWQD